jgi:hypothetical protein
MSISLPSSGSINHESQDLTVHGFGSITCDYLLDMRFSELHWNIKDILPAGTTLLSGKPKKGKSFLSLMMAICIASGHPVFGRETPKCRVLYLGLEDSLRRLQRRVKQCSSKLGINRDEFAHNLMMETECRKMDEGLSEQLSGWIGNTDEPCVIFIDMLKKIKPASKGKNVYEEDAKTGDLLTKFSHDYPNLSIVVIHHNNSTSSEDVHDEVSGSTGLTGSFDSLAVVSESKGIRTLYVSGRDVESIEIPLDIDERGAYTLKQVTVEQREVRQMSPVRRRVYDAVPSTTSRKSADILRFIHKTYPNEHTDADINQQLRLLTDNGYLNKPTRGQYQKSSKFFKEFD